MLESNGASVVAPNFQDFSQNTANGSGSHSKYIRSGRNNPCPVCDRVKDADCSWYPDGRTVMCKSCVDGTGHDESKWHYTGVNELGFQGKFVLKQEREFVKARRSKARKDYYYPNRDGSPLVKITRIDDGSGNKKFPQHHWDGSKWINGNPEHIKRLVPIYRYQDVRAAIGRGELVFVVEGEEVADALWELGIPATTTIGGSGGYANYGSYVDDLKDARLVLAPDRDANGLKYISDFERDFTSQIEGWYLAGTLGLWRKPQGGMDIHDDIRDWHYTKEQILVKVVSPQDYQHLISKTKRIDSAEEANQSPYFITNIADGLVKVNFKKAKDGELIESREAIGNHLAATAYINNPDRDGAALRLEFKTIRGEIRYWTMPALEFWNSAADNI